MNSSEGLSRTIARLRKLEAAATPGEWKPRWDEFSSTEEMAAALTRVFSRRDSLTLIFSESEEKVFPFLTGNGPTSEANAEFIAEMRNALPQLLDRLEKLEAVAELSYTLKHIVDHLPQQDEHFESFLRQTSDKLEDALAVLQEGK